MKNQLMSSKFSPDQPIRELSGKLVDYQPNQLQNLTLLVSENQNAIG